MNVIMGAVYFVGNKVFQTHTLFHVHTEVLEYHRTLLQRAYRAILGLIIHLIEKFTLNKQKFIYGQNTMGGMNQNLYIINGKMFLTHRRELFKK